MVKTAVIILNWNGRNWLEKFLPSVIAAMPENAEIVVADNHSDDDSVGFMQSHYPQIRQLKFDTNLGFAGGYNRAIEMVEAELIVLLNSDVEVPKGWLEPLIEFMDQNPAYAACQPKIRWHAYPEMFEYAGASGGFIDKNGYPYCRGRIFSTLEKDLGQYDNQADVLWATGACLMIRRYDYLEAGGLDELFFAHMEEIDLCWRLWNRNRKIAVIPASHVFHVGGGSLPRSSARKTYLNFRNNLLLLHKNYPVHLLRSVLRRRWWLDRLAMIMFFLQGHTSDAKAVLKAWKDFRKLKAEIALSITSEFPIVMTDVNILKKYYIKGKKHYSNLF